MGRTGFGMVTSKRWAWPLVQLGAVLLFGIREAVLRHEARHPRTTPLIDPPRFRPSPVTHPTEQARYLTKHAADDGASGVTGAAST